MRVSICLRCLLILTLSAAPVSLYAHDTDAGHTMGSTMMFSRSGELGEVPGGADRNDEAERGKDVDTGQDARLKALSGQLDAIDTKLEAIRALLERHLGHD